MGQCLSDLFPRDPDEPIDNTYHGYGDTTSIGSGTIHPVAMTLDDVMKVCWRVRRWDVELIFSWATFYIFGWQLTNGGANTQERDIVLSTLARPFGVYDSLSAWGLTQSLLFDGSLCATSIGRGGDPFIDFENTENVRYDAGDYYPSFFIAFTASQETPTFENEVFSTFNDGGGSGPSGTMDFFGYPVDLYYYSGGSTLTSCTMVPSTVADSWWPYAPTSGGLPVFDDTTGAQLNPNIVVDATSIKERVAKFFQEAPWKRWLCPRQIWKLSSSGSGLLVPAF